MDSAPDPVPRYIYKILPSAPETPHPAAFPLSELDAKDGFVHLSTAKQVPQTAGLFFTTATALWIVKLELAALADPLRWENGFPHLYGNFGAADVVALERVERRDGQGWAEGLGAHAWLE